MGRQYYLHRMALGRSTYGPGDAIKPPHTEEEPAPGHYIQQYDPKGNPSNPAISAFNKTMREAQNEALLLTGVVERKERDGRRHEIRRRESRARRESLLVGEHETGEALEYIFIPVSFLSHMWLEAIVKRIQIGAYPPGLSVLSILKAEIEAIVQPGRPIKLLLAKLFPALGGVLSQLLMRFTLEPLADRLAGRLRLFIHNKRVRRKASLKLCCAISIASEAVLAMIEFAILPLGFYTTAQTLSLIPALPMFPRWDFMSPTGPNSFHAFGWKGTTALFTSPAVLLSISALLRDETAEECFPICSSLTSFRWPKITDDPAFVQRPVFTQDPLGWSMYRAWSTRTSILQWTGWRVVKLHPRIPADADLENDTLLDENNQLVPTAQLHRSTNLAHCPPRFLGYAIDALFRKIALLPFESLMLRSVAFATVGPSESAVRLYAPFGGPLSRILRPGGWAEVGAYASRLGLGIMLNAFVDVALFLGYSWLVRSVGIAAYEWAPRKARIQQRDSVRVRGRHIEAERVLE